MGQCDEVRGGVAGDVISCSGSQVGGSAGDELSSVASQWSATDSVKKNEGKKRMACQPDEEAEEGSIEVEAILEYLSKVKGEDKNAIFENMKSGIPLFEDIPPYLARELGMAGTLESTLPRRDEDFVAYIARTNGIKDEMLLRKMREVLAWDGDNNSQSSFSSAALDRHASDQVDQAPLAVGEEEDAMSFFVRAGSWESPSSISEDLASAGLEDDEDAVSYLMRTGNLSADSVELGKVINSGWRPSDSGSSCSSSRPQTTAVVPGQGKRKLIAMTSGGVFRRDKLIQPIGQAVSN